MFLRYLFFVYHAFVALYFANHFGWSYMYRKGKKMSELQYIEYSIYEAYILLYSYAKMYPSRFKYRKQIMQQKNVTSFVLFHFVCKK